MAPSAECPPSMPEALTWVLPQHHKPSKVVQACDPSIRRIRQKDQGHPQLHCEFEVSLGYVGPCRKEEERGRKGKGRMERKERETETENKFKFLSSHL